VQFYTETKDKMYMEKIINAFSPTYCFTYYKQKLPEIYSTNQSNAAWHLKCSKPQAVESVWALNSHYSRS
jgi:hypothetical protein